MHLGAPRHEIRTLARLGRAGLLLIAALLLGVAAAQPAPARITAVAADPTSAEEGAYVDFTATIDPGDEGSLVHTWDFGDGVTATGIDLLAFRHRYRDDGTYTVTHGIERSDGGDRRTATTSITVANVAPQVRRIETSHGPIPGFPVTLSAAAFDPGDDTLTYTWDFGDGTPPTPPSELRGTVHTFERAGTYVVTVTVDDGDGGSDTLGLEVVVGDGFGYELSGDVTARPRDRASPTLTGLPIERGPDGGLRFRGDLDRIVAGDPNVTDGPGSCLVLLSSQSASMLGHVTDGTTLAFSAALANGLAVGTYPIAVAQNDTTLEWHEPWELEFERPGTFHASLLDVVGDGFDSDATTYHAKGGTFTIERYDGRRLEASFQLDLEESLTVSQVRNGVRARTAHVFGVVRHDISRIWGEDFDGLNAMTGSAFGDAYLCGADEELNVVSHDMGTGPETAAGATPSPTSAPAGSEAPPAAAGALLPPTAGGGSGAATQNVYPWRWEPYANGDAKLEFTFDRPMNPDTLNDRTVWLDIPVPLGPGSPPFEPITGIVEAVSDTTFRFLPDWDMRDGVVYEVTIRGGEDGVRGANGEILEEDYTWSFTTHVEIEAVVATATQVSRGAMLVPNKPAVVRVYTFWSGHDDLPLDVQARYVDAVVRIEVDGAVVDLSQEATIRRPDFYSDAERANALHTVNFFEWTPTRFGGRSTLRATVELDADPRLPGASFESPPVPLRFWTRSPTLTIDYYFLEIDDWASGVPKGIVGAREQYVQRAADFATQTLPVLGVAATSRGPLSIDEPEMEIAAREGSVWRTKCIVPNTEFVFTDEWLVPDRYLAGHGYGWRLAWELHRATRDTTADVVVGIVPQGVAQDCGWFGVLVNLRGEGYANDVTSARVILISEDGPVPVLAHELGHFFGLCHRDDPVHHQDGCIADFGTSIEGFRIELDGVSGHNKSQSEGNGEGTPSDLVALMHRTIETGRVSERNRFITDDHYRYLFTTMAQRDVTFAPFEAPAFAAPPGNAVLAQAVASDAPRVSVWALVAPDGRAIAIDRLRPTSRPLLDEPSGTYTVALLDAGGVELARVAADAYAGEGVPNASDAANDDDLDDASDGPVLALDAVLPFDARAHAVVVARDGLELARITRSPNPPTIDAHLEGTTLHWDADDADGDPVVVDVDYAPDGQAWVPLAVGQPSTGSRMLHSGLEPGSDPVLRVRASDGFDTVERWVSLEDSPPLQVVVRSHADGATLEPAESLWVGFNAPFAEAHDPSALASLSGPDGQPVEIDARLLPGDRRLLLTPREALAPGGYRVDVGGAFRAFDTAPPDGSTWHVVVEAAEIEPVEAAAREPAREAVAASIPATCAGVERATIEALLPDGHELEEVEDGTACTVRARVAAAPDRARADLEFALLRNRYLPTRNVQEGTAVVIDFEGNGRAGNLRLEPDGAGSSLTLKIAPR